MSWSYSLHDLEFAIDFSPRGAARKGAGLHGGSVTLDPAPGGGTDARLTLSVACDALNAGGSNEDPRLLFP